MKKICCRWLLFVGMVCLMAGLSGCAKKEKDPQTMEVIKLSVTPEPTPTDIPKVVNSDSVSTNGNLKMVNEYRANKAAEEEAKKAERKAKKEAQEANSGEDASESDASESDTSEDE